LRKSRSYGLEKEFGDIFNFVEFIEKIIQFFFFFRHLFLSSHLSSSHSGVISGLNVILQSLHTVILAITLVINPNYHVLASKRPLTVEKRGLQLEKQN